MSTRRRVITAVAVLIALSMAATCALAASGPAILVANTSPFGVSARSTLPVKPQFPGGYQAAILDRIGYRNVTEFTDADQFVAEWNRARDKYQVLIIAYHGFRDSARMQRWVKEQKDQIEAWVKAGGAIIATVKDAEDRDLVRIFGIDFVTGPYGGNQAIINITPGTPISARLNMARIDTSKSDDPTFWDGHHFPKAAWPEWVKFTVLESNDGVPAAIAGTYSKGKLVFSGAEITNLDMGLAEEAIAPGFLTFFKALLDWAVE